MAQMSFMLVFYPILLSQEVKIATEEPAAVVELATSPEEPEAATKTPVGDNKELWQKDADAPNCLICKSSFGIFTRKHHCRVRNEMSL